MTETTFNSYKLAYDNEHFVEIAKDGIELRHMPGAELFQKVINDTLKRLLAGVDYPEVGQYIGDKYGPDGMTIFVHLIAGMRIHEDVLKQDMLTEMTGIRPTLEEIEAKSKKRLDERGATE